MNCILATLRFQKSNKRIYFPKYKELVEIIKLKIENRIYKHIESIDFSDSISTLEIFNRIELSLFSDKVL